MSETRKLMNSTSRFHKAARKTAVTITGSITIIVGVILMPLPGPGTLIVLAGVAVLSKEYDWAENIINKTTQLWKAVKHKHDNRHKPQ